MNKNVLVECKQNAEKSKFIGETEITDVRRVWIWIRNTNGSRGTLKKRCCDSVNFFSGRDKYAITMQMRRTSKCYLACCFKELGSHKSNQVGQCCGQGVPITRATEELSASGFTKRHSEIIMTLLQRVNGQKESVHCSNPFINLQWSALNVMRDVILERCSPLLC